MKQAWASVAVILWNGQTHRVPETIKSPDMFVLKYNPLRCHQAWYVNFTNQSAGKLVSLC